MRQVFITNDGEIWENEKNAMKHELTISTDLLMYDEEGHACMDIDDAMTMNIRTEEGVKLLKQACAFFHCEEPEEVEEPGDLLL